MDGRAASLTISDKVDALHARGIEVIVISAATGEKDHRFQHYQVMSWAPSGLKFEIRHMLKKKYGKRFTGKLLKACFTILLLPFYIVEKIFVRLDSEWSWVYPAYYSAKRIIQREKPDIVYTSGGPPAAHKAGYWLKKNLGIFWIAEIHDPMIHDDWSKSKQFYTSNEKLESAICDHADLAWWFTQGALDSARARNPNLGERGVKILPGVKKPHFGEACYVKGTYFNILHAGSVSKTRNLHNFIIILAKFFAINPALKDSIRIHIYGSDLDPISNASIEEQNLDSIFVRHGRLEKDKATGKSGRQRVLEAMRGADLLLMLHGEIAACAEYIPSKFYEYLFTKRPILGMIHDNDDLRQMLDERSHFSIDPTNHMQGVDILTKLHAQWASSNIGIPDFEDPRAVSVDDAVDHIAQAIEQRMKHQTIA